MFSIAFINNAIFPLKQLINETDLQTIQILNSGCNVLFAAGTIARTIKNYRQSY